MYKNLNNFEFLNADKTSSERAYNGRKRQQQTVEVSLELSIFSNFNTNSSICSIKEKWLVNLSPVTIPHDIQCFLQLGENFLLPPVDLKKKKKN